MTGSTEISILAAAGSEGGGAEIGQVIGMTVVALIIGALLCWLGYLHRARKITWVNSVAEYAGRKFKRPPWVAVPMALFIATLICALFGFIWDVSLHIGKGRDPGPLANPAQPIAQAVGVADARMAGLMAGVFAARGNQGLVVHGGDGLDELTTTTASTVWVYGDGRVTRTALDPADLAERHGQPVLARIGGELAQDLAGDDCTGRHAGGKPQHVGPAFRDQSSVDPAPDQLLE